MSIWRKILRRLGLVQYKDYMVCRDALAYACNCLLNDDEADASGLGHLRQGEWLDSNLHNASLLCDYPAVWESYTEEMKHWLEPVSVED